MHAATAVESDVCAARSIDAGYVVSLLGHVGDPVFTHSMLKLTATIQCSLAQYAVNFNFLYLAPVVNPLLINLHQIRIGFVTLPNFQAVLLQQFTFSCEYHIDMMIVYSLLPLAVSV